MYFMKNTLIIIFIYTTLNCFSQEENNDNKKEITKFEQLSKFPLASVSYTSYSNSRLYSDNHVRETSMSEINADAQFVIKIKEKMTYFINRIHFNQFNNSGKEVSSKEYFHNKFYSIAYSAGIIRIINNKWKVIGILTPTIASSFEKRISTNDLILQSSIIASKRVNRYFEYGFGLSYSTRFGQGITIPLVSAKYKKNNFSFTAILPAYISASYHFKKHKIGLSMSTYGNLYNTNIDMITSYELDKLGYSRINIGTEFQMKIYKSLHLNIKGGISVRNKFESINKDGNLEISLSGENKSFFCTGLHILI